jgi:hypothetical protein
MLTTSSITIIYTNTTASSTVPTSYLIHSSRLTNTPKHNHNLYRLVNQTPLLDGSFEEKTRRQRALGCRIRRHHIHILQLPSRQHGNHTFLQRRVS